MDHEVEHASSSESTDIHAFDGIKSGKRFRALPLIAHFNFPASQHRPQCNGLGPGDHVHVVRRFRAYLAPVVFNLLHREKLRHLIVHDVIWPRSGVVGRQPLSPVVTVFSVRPFRHEVLHHRIFVDDVKLKKCGKENSVGAVEMELYGVFVDDLGLFNRFSEEV